MKKRIVIISTILLAVGAVTITSLSMGSDSKSGAVIGEKNQSFHSQSDAAISSATSEAVLEVTPPLFGTGTLPPKPEHTYEITSLPTGEENTNIPTATSAPTLDVEDKPEFAETVKPDATQTPNATQKPTAAPTSKPTVKPEATATPKPTSKPTVVPTSKPTVAPTSKPTVKPAATATPKPIPEITIYTCEDDVHHCWDEVKDEYVDLLEERIVYYLNLYRAEEGMAPATRLPGLSEYAALRAWQSENYICGSTKNGHVCEPFVCGSQGHNFSCGLVAAEILQYGKYVDPSEWGSDREPYWIAEDGEAYRIGGTLFDSYTIDENARRVVGGFRNSSGHWNYLGDDYYRYVGVGISPNGQDVILTVSKFDDNHVSYHEIHNPAYTYPDNPLYDGCTVGNCHCDEYN